jgi:3-hydroxyacyl-CoA dehydrogenase/enoyl-CoA hydratase/3-hydroxybutyryl-CoA epimerase
MTTYNNFTFETDADGVALITWDQKERSMNVITQEWMTELDQIIDAVVADEAIKGAVITSGKSTFSGGADITMLNGMYDAFEAEKAKDEQKAVELLFENAGTLTWIFRKLETCGKPFVSAINGTCMGGATELSLACHARLGTDDEKWRMGLPEVKIGIFPGAGGTVRVPRMVPDMQSALLMLMQGSSLKAIKAKAMGLIDDVVPAKKLVASAKKLIKDCAVDPVKEWDKKSYKPPRVYSSAGSQLWPAVGANYRKNTHDNYPGAKAIVKVAYESLLVPFDTGLKIEQRYFTDVLRSTEARHMIRSLFISMQELNKGARRPADVPQKKLKKVGVLGAGFMGAGIAYVTAKAGMQVVLIDRDQEAADKGKAHCEDLEKKAIQKGRSTQEKAEQILSLITATPDYDELKDVDLVIEAVFEDRDVKAEVTAKAEAVMKPSAIYASNTSTLPITGLAKASKRPKNFIGIHFFSPVDRMMLTEVIMGKRTGDKALAVALDFVMAIKKTPIVVNDTRGFYVNRCVLQYISEAYNMLIEGVPAAMVENAATMAGMPVGPLALNDEIALDLSLKIFNATVADLGEDAVDADQFALVKKLVEDEGRMGRKNGKGFYDYPDRPAKKHLWPELKSLYPQLDADSIDFAELQDRFWVLQALEAAKTIEEGVVTDVREADVGSILGYGFSPQTGGTISYIDGMGTKAFVEKCQKLARKHGKRFRPTKLLKQMAINDEKFYDRFNPYADPKGDAAAA